MSRRDQDSPAWPLSTAVELVQDVSKLSSPVEGFLRRYRHRLKTVFDDGTRSDVYTADYIDREESRRDAITVAVYARSPTNDVADTPVLLRRQLRYAAWVRAGRPLTTELIAGLIEDGEAPEATAVRELFEEAGITAIAQVRPLGRPFFPLPAILTELIHPLAVEVPHTALESAIQQPPPGDGSPFEEGSVLHILTLGEVFELIERAAPVDPRALTLDDAKTELVLARLWRLLEGEQ